MSLWLISVHSTLTLYNTEKILVSTTDEGFVLKTSLTTYAVGSPGDFNLLIVKKGFKLNARFEIISVEATLSNVIARCPTVALKGTKRRLFKWSLSHSRRCSGRAHLP